MFGDFGQLPPVGDRPLFAQPCSTNELSIHGHRTYLLFDNVVILNQVIRQSGSDTSARNFRQLLLRIRNGQVTQNDWQLLLQRDPQKCSNTNDFKDAIRQGKCC